MHDGAVDHERDADSDIQRAEPVEEEAPLDARGRGRREAVKDHEGEHGPEERVDDLERELGGGVEEGEERDVAGNGEGLEGGEVAAVAEGDEGEGDDDEENGLFVHVPPEEEGRVAAEGDGADEVVPGRAAEEFDEGEQLEGEGQEEADARSDFGEDGEGGVADEAPGGTGECLLLNCEAEARGGCVMVSEAGLQTQS
jgi:hypothetical protein